MTDPHRNAFKGKRGPTRIINAVKYSFFGFRSAWKDEEAFRQIIVLGLCGTPAALYLGRSFTETMLLMLPFFLCAMVELLNSAIENAIDRISLERHELSQKAKDMGSAAQFTAQIYLILTWCIFVAYRLF